MHTGVLVGIIVEPDSFCLRSCKDWTGLAKNFCLEPLHILSMLLRDGVKTHQELLEDDLAGSLVLHLSKNQVDVRVGTLLVDKLAVLCKLGEGLSIHLFCTSGELGEALLERAGS